MFLTCCFLCPDITFCGEFLPPCYLTTVRILTPSLGDWAGNSYASTTCPGTCDERLMDPTNFIVGLYCKPLRCRSSHEQNATWIINHLKVYRKQTLTGTVTANAMHIHPWSSIAASLLGVFGILSIWVLWAHYFYIRAGPTEQYFGRAMVILYHNLYGGLRILRPSLNALMKQWWCM